MTVRPTRPGVDTSLGNHEERIRILERQLQFPNRMPWVLFQGDLNGQSIPSGSDYFPELTGLLVNPLNAGGTVDDTVFGGIAPDDSQLAIMDGGSSNEPFKAVEIFQPGLYRVEVSIGWYLNWGGVRVQDESQHSDAEQSVIRFQNTVHTAENSYFGGASDATAPQIALISRNVLAIDERATDVHVRGYAHNFSGSTRTYGTDLATNAGNFSLFIIQLSPSGHSNP